jgi:HTH-type transcriptional regulator/antitoxin HigA
MNNDTVKNIAQNWSPLSPLLAVPRTEDEYDARVELMNQLIDEIGEDEAHPLARLLDTVGALVTHYEAAHYPINQ